MASCIICKKNDVMKLIDLGMQPVCHKFLKSKNSKEKKFPLAFGICRSCGLAQLIKPFPASELRPIYSWVTYKEPEGHLDKTAEIIAKKFPNKKDAKMLGLSFKDDSTLERLRKLGFSKIQRLDMQKDLGADTAFGGVETVQLMLTAKTAKKIAEKYGKFDIVVARHILEHVYNISEFTSAVKELLNPEGIVLFEAPDYTKPFELLDYSSIWEEHISYFTPETFKNCFGFLGFSVEKFEIFEYPMENSLVAIVKPSNETKNSKLAESIFRQETERTSSFAKEFPKQKELAGKFFSDYAKDHGKIAVFGAGHAACLLINIFGLAEHIDCVIDDDENKQGLFMPGSKIPIFNSSGLIGRGIKLCVFAVNPSIEHLIMEKNSRYLQNKGTFLSFSPASKVYIFAGKQIKKQINLRKVDKQVYYSTEHLALVGKGEIQFLIDRLNSENLERIRLCTHKTVDDAIHEMFIVLKKGSYIRPHKHLNKPESFYLIEGKANVIILDEHGSIREIIKMGDYASGRKMYYRMDEAVFHTLVVLSGLLVYKEVTQGPFKKSDTIFADWAPEENDEAAGKEYLKKLMMNH